MEFPSWSVRAFAFSTWRVHALLFSNCSVQAIEFSSWIVGAFAFSNWSVHALKFSVWNVNPLTLSILQRGMIITKPYSNCNTLHLKYSCPQTALFSVFSNVTGQNLTWRNSYSGKIF
jgi:hypothetical protein